MGRRKNYRLSSPIDACNDHLFILQEMVESVFGLRLTSTNRSRPYIAARSLFNQIAYRHKIDTLTAIGKHIGRTHASVLNSQAAFMSMKAMFPNQFAKVEAQFKLYYLDYTGEMDIKHERDITKLRRRVKDLQDKLREQSELGVQFYEVASLLQGLNENQRGAVIERIKPIVYMEKRKVVS